MMAIHISEQFTVALSWKRRQGRIVLTSRCAPLSGEYRLQMAPPSAQQSLLVSSSTILRWCHHHAVRVPSLPPLPHGVALTHGHMAFCLR